MKSIIVEMPYIGYGISVLLFLGGYVAAGFIIWG